jgi:hypothetical protein
VNTGANAATAMARAASASHATSIGDPNPSRGLPVSAGTAENTKSVDATATSPARSSRSLRRGLSRKLTSKAAALRSAQLTISVSMAARAPGALMWTGLGNPNSTADPTTTATAQAAPRLREPRSSAVRSAAAGLAPPARAGAVIRGRCIDPSLGFVLLSHRGPGTPAHRSATMHSAWRSPFVLRSHPAERTRIGIGRRGTRVKQENRKKLRVPMRD